MGPRNHQVNSWLVHPFWLQWLLMRHTPLSPTPTRELARRPSQQCTTTNGGLAQEPAGTRHGERASGGNEIDHAKLNKVGTTRMSRGRVIPTGRRPDTRPDSGGRPDAGPDTPPFRRACDQGAAIGHAHRSGEGTATRKVLPMQDCVNALATVTAADRQSASLKRNLSGHHRVMLGSEM